jgi:non-ribosomal peptide synthetase component F
MKRQLTYWRHTLDGAPHVMNLPTDRKRPTVQNYRGASLGWKLSEQVSQEIRELSRREGATLFMTLLAAFKTLLSYYTGSDDIVVGSPIANRVRTELEPMIGFFVNNLVLRTKISGNPKFRELLIQVREMCLGAFANQDVPFEQLVQELRPERSLSRQPLFQVAFALQNVPASPLKLSGLNFSRLNTGADASPFDLIMYAVDRKASLAVRLQYDTALFTSTGVKRICEDYEIILESIIKQPDMRLDDLHEVLAKLDQRRRVIDDKQLKEASLQALRTSSRSDATYFAEE